jgi:hypothetical protein
MQMFLGNLCLPTLECWARSYFPRPNLLLIHNISAMLTSIRMISLCACCNHSFDYSQILDSKNFQGPPLISCPMDLSILDVLKQQMVFRKHG